MSDQSKNPRVTTFGSFMMDLVAYTPRRPKSGETLRGDSFAIALGGKGFNQAISAGRAGAKSAMLGNLGTDSFGDDFMKAFVAEGVTATDIERSDELGSGVGLPVVTGDGDNSIIIIPQSNDLGDADYIGRHRQTIIDSDVLLLQLELPAGGNFAAAKLAKENNVMIILTPAPVAPLTGWEGLVDVVVPNEGEAAELTGIEGDVAKQAQALSQMLGCKNVVITLGPKGAFVTDGQRSETISAPKVTAIDTIGAGDTMCANLATRLAAGDDIFTATQFGVYAATLKVTRKGAAMASPTPSEVQNFISENKE
jgi:ribokinase